MILGIESSAHTLGVGIVDNGKILANSKKMYDIKNSGMIPAKVADFHAENVYEVIESALESAGININQLDGIGYTKGPGIGPCLHVGQLAALYLAYKLKLPIYPVNHAIGHIEVTKHLAGFKDPLALYVSGGNSQVLGIVGKPRKHYHVYGETLDIGVGNMLDNFARAAKLVPAWGSTVAKAAENGKYIKMPYNVKGMDFTFTGLLTNAVKLLSSNRVSDIAFSLQETAFSMLTEATERALMLTGKKELVLSGGVAQSQRLRGMLGEMAESHGVKFYDADNQFNADNGAMIALVAEEMHNSGAKFENSQLGINQKYRIDKVDIL
ncbi:N6-threonylcarbamoyl-adenosine(37)-tRNA synthase threonyl-carbamoyl transferase subunit Kae1 [Candidatus Mancarchaeum acidiphilum]|uniref:N(6)-L-threonylcarbamoyladenine synthase n=1 Tax=Candidatus Mancarchaeum acidiphilum TaxID=1920749 RepID=A0A218NNF2_9ARCH|nr:KEOPS complex N(6)-L-threonylcarbamoyladenine synthase Kae1 [Candidatus Mancarchaeum acidiphilum]ASI14007.1 N6-threonylcarbamoyl-adenosine(37)-tRNA synthase threonyl-carbamoyl transferase subunit Kae1 [Candidatus Mancarchaeum acidiphilum]